MKVNQDKCHFLSSLDISEKSLLPACILKKTQILKLFGVTVDRKWNLKGDVIKLCDKASQKIKALARIFPCITQTQKRLLMDVYFMSKSSYCSLVWMDHSRIINKCIDGLHKRAL